ncbi:hypothetical protein PRK78_001346 [Emydomyces testavorans]|uniref:Synaptobrevin n=1 Tax=Emydomyces testavorans TaxID=2070801 RepID=A0AAF0DDX2_9EURO|nr:hypothetical protein PRK78_001346 [Emydomyces testavorans]
MTKTSSEANFSSYESINLAHILSRLQGHLLSPSADLKLLRRSKYHRARVAANVEYGRSLLLQLERSLPNIKSPTRKHALQTELSQQRQLLKTLRQRIDELAIEAETLVEEDGFSSEDEDILPTPAESTPERTPSRRGAAVEELPATKDEKRIKQEQNTHETLSQTPEETISKQPNKVPSTPDELQTTSILRSRHHPTRSLQDSHATAIPSRFTSATKPSITPFPSTSPPTEPSATKTHTTETALTNSRLEQDSLTESLLSLATQLKASSQSFHTHLESEKSILSRATEGLDRNTTGLEAAGKRMGMLRRMTEGRGWWGRILMYLWIFGLWIVAVLIVFVGPKLRF